jgi:hypothetical protein
MRYSIYSAAMATSLLLAAPAFAQVGATSNPPSSMDQPSGGVTDSNIAAPTGAVQGSTTGEGNMNGPMQNGMSANTTNNSTMDSTTMKKRKNADSTSMSDDMSSNAMSGSGQK